MNRSDLRQQVIEITNRSDKSSLIDRSLNFGLEQISARHYWRDLVLTEDLLVAAEAKSTALPDDCNSLFEVRLIDGLGSRAIILRDRRWLSRRFPNVDEMFKSKPAYCYRESGQLFWVPQPSEDLTVQITYYRPHPKLETDSDELLIPVSGPLVNYACYWTYKSIEMYEESQIWLRDYEIELDRIIKRDRDVGQVRQLDTSSPTDISFIPDYLDPFKGYL